MTTSLYSYTDSLAGTQTITFTKLSAIIQHIEDFGHAGEEESGGVIYQDGTSLLIYTSKPDNLSWSKYEN